MSKKYYYLDATEEVCGPFELPELDSMHKSGKIMSNTQVCEEGTEKWTHFYLLPRPSAPKQKVIRREEEMPRELLKTEPKQKRQEFQGITKNQGFALIVILLVGIGAPFWVYLKPIPKWEYKTVEILADTDISANSDSAKRLSYKTIKDYKLRSELSSLGSDGWELVSTFLEVETAHPNFGKEDYVTGLNPNVRPQKLVCILKRLVR
jgi:hypothetical protein